MRGFGNLEAVIMDRLWSAGHAMSVREMRAALADERDWAYTTVMTVMDNLHSKGMLRRNQEGRAFMYQPIASREAYVAQLMSAALSDSLDRTTVFRHFVEGMTREDSAALQRVLRRSDRTRSADG